MTNPDYHCFESSRGHHLLCVDGSRVYDIDTDLQVALQKGELPGEIRDLSLGKAYIAPQPIEPPPVRSLSLSVSQGCNLRCTYCYADHGRFGTNAHSMTEQVARNAVDRFLDGIPAGEDAVLGFIGGEPLLARKTVHSTTRYAADQAAKKGVRLRFSITTNATLLNGEDARLFAELPFSVSVSLDGDRESNDRVRLASRSKFASYDAALNGLEHMLDDAARPRHVSIRATVTPRSGPLLPILDHLIGLGLDSVGFSPVLVSPNPRHALADSDFEPFLEQMIACGQRAKEAIRTHTPYPFSNFETALQEIAKGTHRPYPCGAGAGYLSVNSRGDYYSCHRTIDDPRFRLGSAGSGPDDDARKAFLADRHVLNQAPCNDCWARFLCGGGCHHEAVNRGRPACDYVRGWLEFCLASFAELVASAPGYFVNPKTFFQTPVEESHHE